MRQVDQMNQVSRIPIGKIRESLVTLRTEYDPEKLEELGESLADQGQLQTIVVQRGDEGFFDLVIGSRRLRAARHKHMRDIAAYVIEKRSPVDLLLIALAENLHRADLNPFEEAQGFLRLMKEYGLSLKDVAKGVNKPERYVTGRLQLLSMPDEVIGMVSQKELAINSVRKIARLPTGEDQVRMARMAVKHHLTQSELTARVRHELEEPAAQERVFYELTSMKVQMRIGVFATFLEKVPRRMKMHRLNASERLALIKSLQMLEDKAKVLREAVGSFASMMVRRDVEPGYHEAANDGQEWTTRDIRRINSPSRPSDRELAAELGRSVAAIRAMRSQTAER